MSLLNLLAAALEKPGFTGLPHFVTLKDFLGQMSPPSLPLSHLSLQLWSYWKWAETQWNQAAFFAKEFTQWLLIKAKLLLYLNMLEHIYLVLGFWLWFSENWLPVGIYTACKLGFTLRVGTCCIFLIFLVVALTPLFVCRKERKTGTCKSASESARY